MNTKEGAQAVPLWAEIEARVVASFDSSDGAIECALFAWLEHVATAQRAIQGGEVVHRFSSPAVLDAAVEFFEADVKENLAIHNVRLARNEREVAKARLRAALGRFDGVFPDAEEGDQVVPEQLAVLRITRVDKIRRLARVVNASRSIAESNSAEDDENASSIDGAFAGMEEFRADLREFVCRNGEQGRRAVLRICDDRAHAERVLKDESMPRPLRFLAHLVIETTDKTDLPQTGGIGFHAGRR